ncbi:hypothetical protein [Desulfonatronum lacustre]|uniref:hypothetical protein n=1 Tax=Desulfonatronum lacustre TaxID=66849 RepID=UPI000490DADC|nr:hypothetical protein [Desulfonatronum lacustre]
MGIYDTVHFPQPLTCTACQARITSTQTKAFENILGDFRIGDCIGHAEELRIVREGLYCNACRTLNQQSVYFVVYRGILTDIAHDLAEAERHLRSFSFERLLLWYHDQYAKRIRERARRHEVERFLRDTHEWFTKGFDQHHPEESSFRSLIFLHNRDILEQSATPLEAIQAFLQQREEADRQREQNTHPASLPQPNGE